MGSQYKIEAELFFSVTLRLLGFTKAQINTTSLLLDINIKSVDSDQSCKEDRQKTELQDSS